MATTPPTRLTYEQMLFALQWLLGERVIVMIDRTTKHRPQPMATLIGELRRGEADDAGEHGGALAGYPADEMIVFAVGDSLFYMNQWDYKRGRLNERMLSFECGRVQVSITIGDDDLGPR